MKIKLVHDPAIPDGPAQALRIQDAIDAVHDGGGGTVTLGPGLYVCSSIFLRTGVELHLEYGCMVKAWADLEDYTDIKDAAENKDQSCVHLLQAIDETDIAITGRGTIDGNDMAFWEPIEDPAKYMYGIFRYDIKDTPRHRPSPLVQLVGCRNVRVDGVTIQNFPGWALHVYDCDLANVTNLIVRGHPFGPHTDGIGINGSRNVMVSHCDVDTGDDAIIIKATNTDSVCRNVVVTNCVTASNCSGLGLGADVYGIISDVTFSNCVVKKALRMIQVEMWFPGTVQRAVFSGISGRTFPDEGVACERPIYIDIQEQLRKGGELGQVKDMVFRDILCESRGRIMMTAQDGSRIDGVTLDNVVIDVPQIEDPQVVMPRAVSMQNSNHSPATRALRAGVVADNIDRLTMRDVEYRWPKDAAVPMHGLACRGVRGLIEDCPRLAASTPDAQRVFEVE